MSARSARGIVAALGLARVAIGAGFAAAPERLARGSGTPDADLMTRSFAVRELALGVGGLVAALCAGNRPSRLTPWAGLGALVDAGDLCAALATRRDGHPQYVPALVAGAGLAVESWALLLAVSDSR